MAIRADVEWKLAILTVPRRVAIGIDLREDLERLEKDARAGVPGAVTALGKICEVALTESATQLAPPRDTVTSLVRSVEDAARYQLFVAVPPAVPDVDIGREDGTVERRFVAEGHAELARWLLDSVEPALTALGDIDPRIAISGGDACISWLASEVHPDPALPAVTRILRAVRAHLVVEAPVVTPP